MTKKKFKVESGHLEALGVLYMAKESVIYKRFVPDLNPILDLVEWKLALNDFKPDPDNPKSDNVGHYKLTNFGREYYEKVIKFASNKLNRILNSSFLEV